jgi:hypothetical protein
MDDWDGLFGKGLNDDLRNQEEEMTEDTSGTLNTSRQNQELLTPPTSKETTTTTTNGETKRNVRHHRKASNEDIRKSAGIKHRRSERVTSALGLVTGGVGNSGDICDTTKTNNSSNAAIKNKKKKGGKEWGDMIGSLFSLGIGHSIREHIKRKKGDEHVQKVGKKEFKQRFPYQLEIPKTSLKTKKFDFEDFAPSCFSNLRNEWGINSDSYLNSMCRLPLSGGQVGEGKSGMLFFFSHDKKYIVKTVTSSELPFFIRIM